MPRIIPSSSQLALLVLATLITTQLPAAPPEQGQQRPETLTVEIRETGGAVSIGGTVIPRDEITLTAQAAGQVDYLIGKEGDRVTAGTLLVSIDDSQLKAQRQAILAQIRRAESARATTQLQYQRELNDPTPTGFMGQMMPNSPMSSMFGGNQTNSDRRVTLSTHRDKIEQAESELAQSYFRLQELDAKYKDFKMVADTNGIILKKHVNEGDTVQPGTPLLTFSEVGNLQLQVDIPVRLINSIYVGAILPVNLDNNQQSQIQAQVAQIYPTADATKHTVRIKLDLPEDAPAAAGMYAELAIAGRNTQAKRVPVLPRSTIVWRSGMPMAYVLDQLGQPRLHLLRLGSMMDQEYIEVLSGLQGGEQVLVNPNMQ